MGAGVPLLNDYKQEFFWKRFWQTVSGGLRLKLGFCAPVYVYVNQLLLSLIPWLIGGVFTILVEFKYVQYDIASYIFGGTVFLFVLLVNLLGEVFKHRKRKVKPLNHVMKILSEDDEVEFDSCCGPHTSNFTVPGKKHRLNIVFHALVSGAVCGFSFWYLLPSTLDALYGNLVTTVILYIFGWITVLISQLPLTLVAPPEPATFRTQDSYEISPLMRHFYVAVCISFHLLARWYPVLFLTDQVMHVVFVFLPLFWSFGLLPPLDALFLWIIEQCLICLLGGSPMASNLGLVLMFLLSVAIFVAELFIPQGLWNVCFTAGCGYLLSINLVVLARRILESCCRRKLRDECNEQPSFFLWRWSFKEMIFHIGMLLITVGVAGVTNNYAKSSATLQSVADYLAYTIAGLLVFKILLSQIQTIYIVGGMFRNPVYPRSVQRIAVFQKRKMKLNVLGHIHRVIVNAVGPLLMLVYLSLSMSPPQTALSFSFVPACLGACRSFRWIWQNSTEAMLDVTIFCILKVTLPTNGWFMQEDRGLQLLVISLFRDRGKQLVHKIFAWITILVKSWTDKKQRRPTTAVQIFLNILFFPLVLAVLIIASFISAPILPLFTLPLCLFGYPRPMKFWPESIGASANTCPDTVFYKHLVRHLTPVFQKGFALGSLGNVTAGQMYLVRYQDRLVWVQVLERGYLYCSLSIKGLELQETSCHAVEASGVDEMYGECFECEHNNKRRLVNRYVFNTLTPCDAAYLKTYSEARNVLTGVIDSPEALKLVSSGFMQALVWTLLHAVCDNSQVPKSFKDSKRWTKLKEEETELAEPPNDSNTMDNIGFKPSSRPGSRVGEHGRLHSPSLRSLGSNWSDDNESLILEPLNKKGVNLMKGLSARKVPDSTSKSSMPPVDYVEGSVMVHAATEPVTARQIAVEPANNIDDLFNDLEFGLPARDVTQTGAIKSQNTHNLLAFKPNTTHGGLLSPPSHWLQLDVNQSHLTKLSDLFPIAWYQHVLSLLPLDAADEDSNDVLKEVLGDKGLENFYTRLVMSCYAIVNVFGLNGTDPVSMGPSHVHRVFAGHIPWSPSLDELEKLPDLKELTLKAYRYAVKMAVDQMVLGEAESMEDLQEYMEDFTNNWHIGNDTEAEWEKSILAGKQTLFCMHQETTQGTFHSRLLTCQDLPVYIGALNGELVRSQWANLVLELLYLTNDDEERYSIQAHSAILRNLTVQAADPPLGYPVYSSPPLCVPTF